jgi:hypothetical protein
MYRFEGRAIHKDDFDHQSGLHRATQFASETCDRAESAIAPRNSAPRLVQIGYLEPVAADRLGVQ